MSKVKIKNRYGIAPNSLLNDPRISLKVKGLFTYIQSKPDDWSFSAEKIALQNKDSKDSILSALKELEEFGYLQRNRYQDEKGYWCVDYILDSEAKKNPSMENPSMENPAQENPWQENPWQENPAQENAYLYSKKDLSKKDLVKKKESKETSPSPSENFMPNFLTTGTNNLSTTSGGEYHSTTGRGGEKNKNLPLPTPQPPVSKIAEQMLTVLRQKTDRSVMDEILAASDLDLPTMAKMFTEYWIYEKNRAFVKTDWKGMVASFEQWARVAKVKEIPAKEVTEGIKASPIMTKVVYNIEKRKGLKLGPNDAGKVNKFVAESGASEKALITGTKNFCNGIGKDWDVWIRAVKNAMLSEKNGEI